MWWCLRSYSFHFSIDQGICKYSSSPTSGRLAGARWSSAQHIWCLFCSNTPTVYWNASLAGAHAHSQQRRCYHKSFVSSNSGWQCCLPFIVSHQVLFWKSWLCSCWFLILNETEWSHWLRDNWIPQFKGPEIEHPSNTVGQWQEAWHRQCYSLLIIYANSVPRDGWLPYRILGASHVLESHFNKATVISFEGNNPVHWLFDLRIQLLLLDSLPSKSCRRGCCITCRDKKVAFIFFSCKSFNKPPSRVVVLLCQFCPIFYCWCL